ncbi:MAG TPA: hypothetical protein VFB80_00335, partial [Pirellulaceae bacterium]|nr:hypothetical protein [Pirellulaceae bacterium]
MLAALSPVDLGVLALYLGALLAAGLYFSGRQKSTSEFLLGSRSLAWLPLGLSLAMVLAAGATFSELPALAYEQGLKCWAIPAALWIVLPVVVFATAPLVRGLSLDSLYQYLEDRFDARVRLEATLIFLAWRWFWLTAMLSVASEALALALGWRWPAWALIVPLGVIATLYTFLGGMRAVAWCGAVHAGLMLSGLAVVIGGVWWNL